MPNYSEIISSKNNITYILYMSFNAISPILANYILNSFKLYPKININAPS